MAYDQQATHAAEILDRAAALIDERGWGQDTGPQRKLKGETGICALEAVAYASGANSVYLPSGIAQVAINHLVRYLRPTLDKLPVEIVYGWNDNIAVDAGEVTSTMRAVAVSLRAAATGSVPPVLTAVDVDAEIAELIS